MKNAAKKSVLLTFDYELFLLKSGTPERCILEPTEQLLDIFRNTKAKATFFVDMLYLWQLKQNSLKEVYQKVEEQLRKMVAEGHRIELHLHPQWIDAKYDGREWSFNNFRYYRLQSLPLEKIEELFSIGTDILHEIAQKEISSYKAFSFRAGGLCIEPFDKLLPSFKKHEIKVDSSVAPGLYYDSDYQKYDFRSTPESDFYFFSDYPSKQNENGEFLELPVLGFQRNISDKFFEKRNLLNEGNEIFGDGLSVSSVGENKKGLFNKLKTKFTGYHQVYSYDMLVSPLVNKKLEEEKRNIITVISHPKLLNRNSLFEMNRLLKKDEMEFLNIKEAYDKIVA